jgi:MYXO-CTERM domain-containing protein
MKNAHFLSYSARWLWLSVFLWLLLPSLTWGQTQTCTKPNFIFVLNKASRMNSPGSPTQNKWNKARLTLGQISTTLNGASRQALVTFESTMALRVSLRDNAFSTISQLLLRESTRGSANHVAGLIGVRNYLLQTLPKDTVANRKTVVVLLSDGTSNDGDPSSVIRGLRSLTTSNGRKYDVKTFVVGFNPGSNLLNLQRWALAGGTTRLYLSTQVNNLISELRKMLPQGSTEVCDGKDNDCDGQVDENLSRVCQNRCRTGTETCSAGKWGNCSAPPPSAEICDGQDNDCDGRVDENLVRACATACGKGTETCVRGRYQGCTAPAPQREQCNGKDDDCDGAIDEFCSCTTGQTRACGTNTGVCSTGIQTCTNGQWPQSCSGIGPTQEICDGKDNDCDGLIDENLTQSCTNACGKGTQTCNAGKWVNCTAPKPTTEVCDGRDNDCDGRTDEGCQCRTGQFRACGTNTGACRAGQQVCLNGRWGTQCFGAINPTAETCDGRDNDCDGQIDENVTRTCRNACGSGTQICSRGRWGSCSAPTPTTEVCDGRDNDCDGQTDEGCGVCTNGQTRLCGGTDVGECKRGTQTCTGGNWGTCVGLIDPKPEVCDGKDNDCDGQVDEGGVCQCKTGQTRLCGGTDVGECKRGTQTCAAGKWGACVGLIDPKPEVCDGKDNDCDGQVDEGGLCQCKAGQTRLCGGTDVGECQRGRQTCTAGKWGVCVGLIDPKPEVCDNKDNDCDGQVDEGGVCQCKTGQTRPCGGTSVGACKLGVQTCTTGKWGACVGHVDPKPEVCDGKDNDCDGQTDEGLTQSCKTACGTGTQTCTGGKYGACSAPVPQPEICDGKDNDCDGQVDENACQCKTGQTRLCGGTDVGECKRGTQTCAAGQWGACVGLIDPKPEVCDNKDNDCDGQTDEGGVCGCQNGQTRPCGVSSVGACKLGKQTCTTGKWSACSGNVNPTTEVCDGQDNDCDGQTDEGGVCGCKTGQTRPCGTNTTGECKQGVQTCNAGNWSACVGEVKPSAEVCDNKDNDCDGQTDEGGVCGCPTGETRPCGDNNTGTCKQGVQTCNDGKWSACIGEIKPSAEVCDGKDNDCDGQIDENLTKQCSTLCGTGTQSCQNGSYTSCNAPQPGKEVCDGKDNNCDGVIDENCECQSGETRSCGVDKGTCRTGTQRCDNGRWSSSCEGGVLPTQEVCNGDDDDCDGQVDNGATCPDGQSCVQGVCQSEVTPDGPSPDGDINDGDASDGDANDGDVNDTTDAADSTGEPDTGTDSSPGDEPDQTDKNKGDRGKTGDIDPNEYQLAGGCGCQTATPSLPGLGLMLLLLGMLGLRRRRR